MTTEHETQQVAFDAFSLAVRVMIRAYGIEAPATEFERPWALLHEIAEGTTTLSSPAEMAARFPELKDFLYDRVNQMVEHDREMAQRVLRGLGGAF